MSEPIAGGRRRVDRVLGEGFLDDLESLSLQELRERRHDAEQEDADLSYIRRLLQGRLDIIRAERERRAKAAGDKVVDHLSEVLGDGTRSTHGSGRFLHVEPSRGQADRVVSGESSIAQAVESVTAEILQRLKPGIRA